MCRAWAHEWLSLLYGDSDSADASFVGYLLGFYGSRDPENTQGDVYVRNCPSRHLDIPLLQPGCWDPCLPSDSLRPLLPIIACSSSPPPPLLVMITLTSDAAPHLLPSLSAFTCRPPPPPSFLTLPPFLFPSSQASAFDSPWPQTICPHAC